MKPNDVVTVPPRKMYAPELYELLLCLLDLNGGSFEGKTNIHKNIYLLQQMLPKVELPARFKLYFYGPYSEDISHTLDLLYNVGLVKITQIGVNGEFEAQRYELTDSGKDAATLVKEKYKDFMKLFEQKFRKLQSTNYHQNTKVLSTATKVKYILSTEGRPLNRKTIQGKARELGWEINDNDLLASVTVLSATSTIQPRCRRK